jgi:hypothetical protein
MVQDQILYVFYLILNIMLTDYFLKLIDPSKDEDPAGSDNEDDENGPVIPEIILDDDGYATLPVRDGIGLKGQHELIRNIFHASYSKIFCL